MSERHVLQVSYILNAFLASDGDAIDGMILDAVGREPDTTDSGSAGRDLTWNFGVGKDAMKARERVKVVLGDKVTFVAHVFEPEE